MVRATSLAISVLLVAGTASAADSAGRVVSLSGEAFIQHADGSRERAVRGAYLYEGDAIETGDTGNVRLLMRDKSVLGLASNSGISITDYFVQPETKKRKATLTVMMGRLWAFVSKSDNPDASYHVRTQTAVAGVRGTELVFDVDAKGNSEVTVIEGEVRLASDANAKTLLEKDRGTVAKDGGSVEAGTASAEAIAEIRETVTPEQELDTASAEARLEATRKKSGAANEDGVEREESGSGNAVFEDAAKEGGGESYNGAAAELGESPPGEREGSPYPGGGPGDEVGLDNGLPLSGAIGAPNLDFDPATMGQVRVTVEVRP